MKRHNVLKIAILTPSVVLVGMGFLIVGINLSDYLTFLDRLSGPDARNCDGERCFCNSLMCVTDAHYRPEALSRIGIGLAFVAAGSFWIVLFTKRDYLKARNIL